MYLATICGKTNRKKAFIVFYSIRIYSIALSCLAQKRLFFPGEDRQIKVHETVVISTFL